MDLMGYITILAGNKEISTKNIQKTQLREGVEAWFVG